MWTNQKYVHFYLVEKNSCSLVESGYIPLFRNTFRGLIRYKKNVLVIYMRKINFLVPGNNIY